MQSALTGVVTEVQKCPCSPLWAASLGDPSKDYVMRSSTGEYPFSRRGGAGISKSTLRETPHIHGRRIFSSMHRFDRHQNLHLGHDLNHCDSQNARLSPLRSGAVVPFHSMRSLPRRPSNSIKHSDRPTAGDVISSTNAGGAVGHLRRGPTRGTFTTRTFAAGLADRSKRFSLPYSKCKPFAVGQTPCSRASSTAAAHNRFGIGKRPVCAFRHLRNADTPSAS